MTDIQEAEGSSPSLHTMEAILKFDLTDEDDREEHLRCTKSLDMALALDDIRAYIVKIWDEEETVDVEILKERFFEILEHRRINTDELVS